jgi:hypothetical protein
MDILLLTTPAQHAADNPAVERNAGRLKHWLAQLPIMDVVATVASLDESLRRFNELQIPAADRLKLLEVYRQAFDDILFTYDEIRLRVLPLSAAQRDQLAKDIIWLYLELANGYKTLVRDGHQQGLSPAQDTTQLLAIYRAMELIGLALVYALRFQQQPPPLSRLELHQLYWYAEQYGVLATQLRAVRRETAVPTIERLYKQYWLLDLADTRLWCGADLAELLILLEEYASHCAIFPPPPEGVAPEMYDLDLLADESPLPHQDGRAMQEGRALDIRPAIQAIAARLASGSQSGADEQEQRLFRMFLEQFSLEQGRRAERTVVRRPVRLVLEFAALHHFLAAPEHLASAGEEADAGDVEAPDQPRLFGDWEVIDESDTGFLLVGKPPAAVAPPVVGSLLGVVDGPSEGMAPLLSVCVVRWRGEEGNGLVKLGVSILEGRVIPVNFGSSEQALASSPQAALYFPRNRKAGRSATLVLPRPAAQSGTHLQVIVHGKLFEVVTDAVVCEAADYLQCRFMVFQAA